MWWIWQTCHNLKRNKFQGFCISKAKLNWLSYQFPNVWAHPVTQAIISKQKGKNSWLSFVKLDDKQKQTKKKKKKETDKKFKWPPRSEIPEMPYESETHVDMHLQHILITVTLTLKVLTVNNQPRQRCLQWHSFFFCLQIAAFSWTVQFQRQNSRQQCTLTWAPLVSWSLALEVHGRTLALYRNAPALGRSSTVMYICRLLTWISTEILHWSCVVWDCKSPSV